MLIIQGYTNMKRVTTISLFELAQKYPTRTEALGYFEELRWGDRPVCPKCGGSHKITPNKKHEGRYWCGHCRSHFNALTNTPMEYGKISLNKWIYAAYLLMTARKGISSMQLSKELAISQKAAWYMLHRLRVACGENMEALSGEVEMDATYIGGKETNKHASKKLKQGRGTVGKQPVIGMRERGGNTRAVAVTSENREEVERLLKENVEKGSTVYSDESRAYDSVSSRGYSHGRVNHSAREYVNGMASTNGVESVWAIIKRGFNGVYHHWSKKHCQKYVNEFTFRLNEGNCKRDTQDRLDDLFRNMVGKTVTYEEITAK